MFAGWLEQTRGLETRRTVRPWNGTARTASQLWLACYESGLWCDPLGPHHYGLVKNSVLQTWQTETPVTCIFYTKSNFMYFRYFAYRLIWILGGYSDRMQFHPIFKVQEFYRLGSVLKSTCECNCVKLRKKQDLGISMDMRIYWRRGEEGYNARRLRFRYRELDH